MPRKNRSPRAPQAPKVTRWEILMRRALASLPGAIVPTGGEK